MSHIRLASILAIGMITLLAVPATAQDEAAGPARSTSISQPIPRSDERVSPSCPT